MQKSDAAGRKTGKAETDLAEQLAAFSQRSMKYLADDQVGDAIILAKSTAKLAFALAKLNGQFSHNITVRRPVPEVPPQTEFIPPDGRPLPPAYPGEPPLMTEEEWRNDSITNEELWARTTARDLERARRAGWVPPSNFEGSNTDG